MADSTEARLSKVNDQLVAVAAQLLGHDEESIKNGEKGCIVISWDHDRMVGNVSKGEPLAKVLWAGQTYLDALEEEETRETREEEWARFLKSIRRRMNR